ncbi:MAG: BrnT family toxin [Bryobacteraceae bacterium]
MPALAPRLLRASRGGATASTQYTSGVEFEWSPEKAVGNLRKHGVSFGEAASVFGDQLSATAPDPDHSSSENRFITIGLSNRGRLLMVAHVERRERIRIVSARTLTRTERSDYEDAQ